MPETVTPPVPTDEELKQHVDEFVGEWFDNDRLDRHKTKAKDEFELPPIEEPETPPAEKKDEPVTPAAATPATPATPPLEGLTPEGAPPAAPAEPPAPPAVPPQAIDTDDLADKVADKIAARQTQPQTPPAPPANPFATFSESDQRQLRVLAHLEKTNPKYAGVAARAQEFYTREAAYKAQWLQKNPGEKFDPAEDTHAEFYDKFEPKIDRDDLEEARIDLIASARVKKEVDAEVQKRVAPIEEKARAAERTSVSLEAGPRIEQSANAAVADLVIQAVPEFKELLPDGRITTKALAAMHEKDPDAVALIDREAQMLKVRVREIESMVQMGTHYTFDEGRTIQTKAGTVKPCSDIITVGSELEQEWAKKPKEQRVRDGKQFIPQHMLQAAIDNCKGDTAKEDALFGKFWIVSPEDIKAEFVRRSAENVKNVLSISNQRAERLSKKVAPGAATPPTPPPTPDPAKPKPTPPPAITGSSDNVDTKIPAAPAALPSHKVVEKAWFD